MGKKIVISHNLDCRATRLNYRFLFKGTQNSKFQNEVLIYMTKARIVHIYRFSQRRIVYSSHNARGAPDSAFYYPAGYQIFLYTRLRPSFQVEYLNCLKK